MFFLVLNVMNEGYQMREHMLGGKEEFMVFNSNTSLYNHATNCCLLLLHQLHNNPQLS